jgi:single-strand DNA-binding protein
MNNVTLMGRWTRDPEIRWTTGDNALCIARGTLAVDRRIKKEGEQTADFISCVAFGRTAEFIEKYFHQGMKIAAVGRIQTGSYTNKDGVKIYTTDVVLENVEFAESKATSEQHAARQDNPQPMPEPSTEGSDGFMNIPDDIDEELPFN